MEKKLKFIIHFLRSKKLSFNNQSLITLKPFLNLDSKFYVDEFDPEIIKEI